MVASPSQVMRQAVDALGRRDFASIKALTDPAIELHIPGNPEQQVWRGAEEFIGQVRAWVDSFDDYSLEVEELREAGHRALAIFVQRGRGQLTGGRVEARNAIVIEVDDGVVTRMNLYLDPAEASAALVGPR